MQLRLVQHDRHTVPALRRGPGATISEPVRRPADPHHATGDEVSAGAAGPAPTLDLVGPSEIATMLGVHRQQVTRWRRNGKMPEPVAVLQGDRPVWYRSQIVSWAMENGKAVS